MRPSEAFSAAAFLKRCPGPFALTLIAIVGLASYSNSFHVPFVFDDIPSIRDNPLIQDLTHFLSGDGYRHSRLRFIAYLTLAVNHSLGGLEVTGYHLFNLTIHLFNAAFLYSLCLATMRTPRLKESCGVADSRWLALLAALLFVAHPVQTQAVTYVVQRMTSLATCFYLLSLLLYAAARLRMIEGHRRSVVRLFFAGVLSSALLAMHSKEIAFTLPLAILLYEASFFDCFRRRCLLLLTPLLALVAVTPLLLLASGKPVAELLAHMDQMTRDSVLISRHDYLLTQIRVIATYLRLLFLPINQNLDYDFPIFSEFFTPSVFLSFLLLVALAALAFWAYRRTGTVPENQPASDRSWRLLGFGICWFFLTLLVESSIIPIRDVINEHRLYLPSAGAALAVASVLVRLLHVRPRLLFVSVTLIVSGLAVATWQRNTIWASELSLWRDAVEKSPLKARPHHNYGKALSQAGDVAGAIQAYERALRLGTPSPETLVNLAAEYDKAGQSEMAASHYRAALADVPDHVGAMISLATILFRQEGTAGEGRQLLQQAVALEPNNAKAHFNLGVAFALGGNLSQAFEHYLQALRINPGYARAHNNLGALYLRQGQTRLAAESFRRAVQLDPGNDSFRQNLHLVLQQ